MNKKFAILLILATQFIHPASAQTNNAPDPVMESKSLRIEDGVKASQSGAQFRSADTALERVFGWAKMEALHFRGQPGDPVGRWYESALPPRYAFCMRDVSHQCLGAEILGMSAENKNMFTKFVTNISASKNWCSYWEINKWDKPAPADYKSDREFWYNLDANFDLMYACWRMYAWTGDRAYLDSQPFARFFGVTCDAYMREWVLSPDSLLTRPAHPNAPIPYDENEDFDRCRGLPSYGEAVRNQKMGVDLVAAMYRGLTTYAAMLRAVGKAAAAGPYERLATKYRERLEKDWWDKESALYYTYYSNDGHFGRNEGENMLLWFDALQDSARKRKTIEHMMMADSNVESQSYFPYLLYREGYWDKAYAYIMHLTDPGTARRDYPEVSYGVVEGVVQGLMGVSVRPGERTIETVYRSGAAWSELTALPVLQTTIGLKHIGSSESEIVNSGPRPFKWRAEFMGSFSAASVDGAKMPAMKTLDATGNSISYVEVTVPPGASIDIKVVR
jgi:hypothetical protein